MHMTHDMCMCMCMHMQHVHVHDMLYLSIYLPRVFGRGRGQSTEGRALSSLPSDMLAISSLLATGWISQPLRQRPHRTAAPLRWDEILCGMTQVVTDIDDTIKSSGGVNIGGIALGGVDTSYERNSFYPGVFQFGLELASHTAKPRDPPNKMAVLTARAEVYAAAAVGAG